MGVLDIRDLRLNLGGKMILDGLNIEFKAGSTHALVGPNGAGKSTLASTIMGLSGYEHFEGELLLDGESLKNMPLDQRARKGITLAWQEPARFEGLTIRKFLKAAADDKSSEVIDQALQTVGLSPLKYGHRAVDKTLSGGERKRVELASILVMKPKIVLMDEPDSGIDVEALERIFEVLRQLKEKGATIILITHSMAVLKEAEYAYLLCSGKVLDEGPIEKIGQYFEGKCLPCNHPNMPLEGELNV